MAAITPTEWRGFVVPDSRIGDSGRSATDSTTTEAGPVVGVPTDQGSSSMVLQASGSKTSASDLDVRIQRAGFPGIKTRGAGFLWRNDASPTEDWRGWIPPMVPMGHEWPGWADGTLNEYAQPHLLRLASGLVLAAYRRLEVGTSTEKIGIAKLTTAGAWTWNHASITPSGTSSISNPWPCLLQLPGGRVLVFYWVRDSTAALGQVQAQYSDDDGDTWAAHSTYALETSLSTAASTGWQPRRLRAAHNDGAILLVGHIISKDASSDPDSLVQYASDDLGATFTQVEILDHTAGDDAGRHDVVALAGGGFVVSYPKDSASVSAAQRRTILGAYAPLSGAAETAGSADDVEAAGHCSWVAEDGTIYATWVVSSAEAAASIMRVERSTDNGATWEWLDDAADPSSAAPKPRPFWIGETSTYLSDVAAVEQQGRTVYLHGQTVAGSPAHEADAIGCLYLGGHSTVTMPPRSLFARDTAMHGLLNTWISVDTPGNIGHYTKTSAGSPTETLQSSGLRTEEGTGETQYWTRAAISTDITDSLIVMAYLKTVGGATAATSAKHRSITIRAADGSEHYEVDINIATQEIEVWDSNAGAQIGSSVAITGLNGVWILAAIRGNDVYVWTREGGPSSDLEWDAGPTSSSLTDGGAGAADFSVVWGRSTATGATTTTDWLQVSYGLHEAQAGLADGQLNSGKFSRPMSASFLGVDDGVRIRAVDGPGAVADEWAIPLDAAYPLRAIDPRKNSSPRRRWRSTGTAQHRIAWTLDDLAPIPPDTGLGAIYLGGINWATGTLEGYTGSAWVTVATIDAKIEGATVAYTRDGSMVSNSGADSHSDGWIQIGELAGGSFKLDATTVRRIAGNTEGRWSTLTQSPRLTLESVVGGDPASGTGEIWASSVAVVYSAPGGVTLSKFRLTIDSQATADGYFEIGVLAIGRFIPLKQYSHGRSVQADANVEITEIGDGTRYSARNGPVRRSVSVAWRDGIDTSSLYGGTPDHYLWGASKASTPDATPLTMEGIIGEIDGANVPVLYLPSVTASRMTLRYREEMLWARLVTGSRREVVVGDERSSEVMRIQTITLEEEI